MTAFVTFTMLGAAKSFLAVESNLARTMTALWFAVGAVLLWLRWRPRS